MSRDVVPQFTGDLKLWATRITNYLQGRSGIKEPNDPRAVQLAHQVPNQKLAAISDGILMYDPVLPAIVYSDNGAWWPIYTGATDPASGLGMHWDNLWAGGTYDAGSVVLDGSYLMIANKDTTDRPAPQSVGPQEWLYKGPSPTGQITAKTLLVQITYTLPEPLFAIAYRAYLVSGNVYSCFLRDESTGQIEQLWNLTASGTGWRIFAAKGSLFDAGTTFTLGLFVTEPDPTPVAYTLSYNYQTPNNAATPTAGNISHANKAPESFRVHKTGQGGQDNSADLAGIEIGDTIEGAGLRWSVSNVTDNGTWIDFTVAPAQQGAPEGVQDFIFETVTATPITTIIDQNDPESATQPNTDGYYASNPNITTGYSIDGGITVLTEDAFGIDVEVQRATVSADWDFMSSTGTTDGGSTAAYLPLSGGTMSGTITFDGYDVNDVALLYDISNDNAAFNSWDDGGTRLAYTGYSKTSEYYRVNVKDAAGANQANYDFRNSAQALGNNNVMRYVDTEARYLPFNGTVAMTGALTLVDLGDVSGGLLYGGNGARTLRLFHSASTASNYIGFVPRNSTDTAYLFSSRLAWDVTQQAWVIGTTPVTLATKTDAIIDKLEAKGLIDAVEAAALRSTP